MKRIFFALTFCALSAIASHAASADTDELLRREDAANDACRGRNVDCDKRDALVIELERNGLCFGPKELPMHQQKWGRCSPAIPNNSAMNILEGAIQKTRACIRSNIAAAYSAGVYGAEQARSYFKPKCFAELQAAHQTAKLDDLAAESFDVLLMQELNPK